ncbi:LacI family transcriptional regulator [Frigoribacterium sp. PhB24]|nr:LacI family transcriptional regulator [Frigoribacterium sp. PhB24]
MAAAAGVSVGTVSNVLNNPDRVSPATVARVARSIDELGFLRNDAARQLRGGDSRAIGLVVLDARNPFFADVARGAEAAAEELGQVILVGNSDQRTDREAHYLNIFAERRVMGVLVSPVGDVTVPLRRLRDHGIPAVLVDREAAPGTLSSVSVDDVAGGRMAVEHLLSLGRRRIAFVGGPGGLRQVSDRLSGARAAVAATPDAVLQVLDTPDLTVEAGRSAAHTLAHGGPGKRPDAVFAANDLVAVGVLQGLVMQSALRVPEDVALIGYDDIDFARATVVPLSSIRQPRELMGRSAVEVLRADAADPHREHERVIFTPELVVRASTG